MKLFKFLFYLSLTSIAIITLQYFYSDVKKFPNRLRNLEINIEDELKLINYTSISEIFNNQCGERTFSPVWNTIEKNTTALSNFQNLFRLNSNLTLQIVNIIRDPNLMETDLPEMIISLFTLLIPIFILLGFTFIGWFTCCSCCCYEYCPIICKKRKDQPYSTTTKMIPVILVIFSGFSLIIPAVMAFQNYYKMFENFQTFYCNILDAEYNIGTGYNLKNNYREWLGLENLKYFDDLKSLEWLEIDTTMTLDRHEEFEKKLNALYAHYDTYTSKVDAFKYNKIIYPSINNKDLTRREYPNYIREFLDPKLQDKSFLNTLKGFLKGQFTSFLGVINDMKSKIAYLKRKKENILSLLTKFALSQKSTMNLLYINYIYDKVFFRLISGQITFIIDLIQKFLLFFQLFVVLLNITSSILVIFKYKGALGKYIGHSSWCLSAFNLAILSFVIFFLYATGLFLINAAQVQKQSMEAEVLENINKEDDKSYASQYYMSCLKKYNQTNLYEFYGYESENKKLDEMTDTLFRLTVYTERDAFKIIEVLTKINSENDKVMDPFNAITNVDPDDKNPFDTLQTLMNRITDYRRTLPYQVFNDCGIPFAIEFQIRPEDCRYPINTDDYISLEQIEIGKFCLIITDISSEELERLFKPALEQCKYSRGKFLEDGFDTIFEELFAAHKIANAYYDEFSIYRDWFIDNILFDSGDRYIKFAKEAQNWVELINTDYVDKINEFFKLPLDDYALMFADSKIKNIEELLQQKILTLNSFIACNVYNQYLLKNIEYINYNIMDSLYTVIVCYFFLFLYNIISAVFGLMTIKINYSEDDEEFIDKKNK